MNKGLQWMCAGLAGLALVMGTGCASTEKTSDSTHVRHAHQTPSGDSARFVHCVFFTFRPGVTDDQITEFIRDCHLLRQIPSVRRLEAGRRDERMARDVNVTDYHVGLVVYFDDLAGHDAYSVHPIHDRLLEKHAESWEKVRVFDFDAQR